MSLWLSRGCCCCSLSFKFHTQFFQQAIYSSLSSLLLFPFHICFWKHRPESPGQVSVFLPWGCNPAHLHWQFNHLALICHKWSLTAANDALIDCSEWNNWQWLKVRLTQPRWNISRTIQGFFFHTCTINYFEGDSYELTMESKSIIVFHYYANYAKNSSKI